MAAPSSQRHRLLVLRECGAPLPRLERLRVLGSTCTGMHENVTVISQFDDEACVEFRERVMSRIAREMRQDGLYRSVVVSIGTDATGEQAAERRRLVHCLAATLALGPNGELVLAAPTSATAALRDELLAVAESVARGAPHLNVRVSFVEQKPAISQIKLPLDQAFLG